MIHRWSRGSNVAGLAGMRAWQTVKELAPLTLGRPLLTFPKARLVQACEEARVPYVVDPTNALPRYRRNAIRLELAQLAARGAVAPEAWYALVDSLQAWRTKADAQLQHFLSSENHFDPVWQYATLSLPKLSQLAHAAQQRVLAHVLTLVRGARGRQPVDMAQAVRLLWTHPRGVACSGCVLWADDRQHVFVYPQAPPQHQRPRTVATGDWLVWGSAPRCRVSGPPTELLVRPLRRSDLVAVGTAVPEVPGVHTLLAAFPALTFPDNSDHVAVPHLHISLPNLALRFA